MDSKTLRKLNAKISQLVATGRQDDALPEIRTSLIPFFEREPRGSLAIDSICARVISSQVMLAQLDRASARVCLSPWLARRDRSFNAAKLEKVEVDFGCDLAGLLATELGNFLFHNFSIEPGFNACEMGQKWLAQASRDSGLPASYVEIARWLSVVWWARLAWRRGGKEERNEALTRLQRVSAEILGRSRGGEIDRRGLDWVAGIALDARAELMSIRGDPGAREMATRAVILLNDRLDRVRSAHALYVLGKIEAGTEQARKPDWALWLLGQARDKFPKDHPYRLRVDNQRAQSLARASKLKDAAAVVLQIEGELLGQTDEIEREYVRKDLLLTKLRLEERNEQPQWKVCLRFINKLGPIDGLPERIRTEALLHLGRARLGLGDVAAALSTLQNAALLAERSGRRRTEIAILFARCEAQHKLGFREDANADFERADELLARIRPESPYLTSLRNRTSHLLGGDSVLRIDLSEKSLDQVVHEARSAAYRYARSRARSSGRRTNEEIAGHLQVGVRTVGRLARGSRSPVSQ